MSFLSSLERLLGAHSPTPPPAQVAQAKPVQRIQSAPQLIHIALPNLPTQQPVAPAINVSRQLFNQNPDPGIQAQTNMADPTYRPSTVPLRPVDSPTLLKTPFTRPNFSQPAYIYKPKELPRFSA